MGKAVLISIQPKWCELIASGEKTLEVRKTKPKLETPFKCYIYCTKAKEGWFLFDSPNIRRDGAVIGEFICDRIYPISSTKGGAYRVYGLTTMPEIEELAQKAQMSLKGMHGYLSTEGGYGWHISDLVIYGGPKELSEFMKPCGNDLYCEECAMFSEFADRCGNKALVLSKAPQSWCYVEELEGGASE